MAVVGRSDEAGLATIKVRLRTLLPVDTMPERSFRSVQKRGRGDGSGMRGQKSGDDSLRRCRSRRPEDALAPPIEKRGAAVGRLDEGFGLPIGEESVWRLDPSFGPADSPAPNAPTSTGQSTESPSLSLLSIPDHPSAIPDVRSHTVRPSRESKWSMRQREGRKSGPAEEQTDRKAVSARSLRFPTRQS